MIRNLIYHITPMGHYEWNLEQLFKRISLFDGQILFAVAQGEKCDDISIVEKKLHAGIGRRPYKIAPFGNDVELRETATFLPLLIALKASAEPGSITFYAHTKGVTHGPDDEAVMRWTRMMYHHNLDRIEHVESVLDKLPVAGCFKRYTKFKNFPRLSAWHYSGTFFWFRNDDLFKREWARVPMMKYGVEGYLSTIFKAKEAGVVFLDHASNMYRLNYTRGIEEKYLSRTR